MVGNGKRVPGVPETNFGKKTKQKSTNLLVQGSIQVVITVSQVLSVPKSRQHLPAALHWAECYCIQGRKDRKGPSVSGRKRP